MAQLAKANIENPDEHFILIDPSKYNVIIFNINKLNKSVSSSKYPIESQLTFPKAQRQTFITTYSIIHFLKNSYKKAFIRNWCSTVNSQRNGPSTLLCSERPSSLSTTKLSNNWLLSKNTTSSSRTFTNSTGNWRPSTWNSPEMSLLLTSTTELR